jgi:hypothetical protein
MAIQSFKRLGRPSHAKRLNVRTALLGLFVVLTILFASTTVYESSIRTTLTSTSTSTSTSTVTATSVSTIPLSVASSQVQVKLSQLEQEYMEDCQCLGYGIRDYYTNNSTITLYGNVIQNMSTGCCDHGGTFMGPDNINLLYGSFWGALIPSPSLSTITNLTLKDLGEGNVNATFRVFVSGTNGVNGVINATIDVRQHWTNQGGTWLIQEEVWDFANSYIQHPGIVVNGM